MATQRQKLRCIWLHLEYTVNFILVCQTAFCDNFFYFLLFLAETFMMCVNYFYVLRNEISAGSVKK